MDFTGAVIDYGTYPEQNRSYFTLRDATKTLSKAFPAESLEARIYLGLQELTQKLFCKYSREDGSELSLDRLLIDANWAPSEDSVYSFCRKRDRVLPSHGRYVGASSKPFAEYKRKKGDWVGHNWRVPAVKGTKMVRHALYDTNYWKTFSHQRMRLQPASRGSLSFYGTTAYDHRLISEQLTSEYRVATAGRERELHEWKHRPERFDNHWFDGVVGCCVAASMEGCAIEQTVTTKAKQSGAVSFAEQQKAAKAKRARR